MGSYENFYGGANYGFDKKYDEFLGMNYITPAGNISLATNPFTANQLQEVTSKLNTGAKALEINMAFVDPQQGAIGESIPNQHLEELNRLRQITGTDFTVHGPLIEPTGVTRQGWDDTHRQQAERQMWIGLERAHKVDPKGNVVVTFHSSNGLPEPETRVIDELTGKAVVTGVATVDVRNGRFGSIIPKSNPLLGKEEIEDPKVELEKSNKESWDKELSQAAFHAHAGGDAILKTLRSLKKEDLPPEISDKPILDLYNFSKTREGQQYLGDLLPETKKGLDDIFHNLNYGDIYVKDAYNGLQTMFNTAWDATKNDKERVKDFEILKEFSADIQKRKEDLKDPQKLAEVVLKGVDVLNSIKTPQVVRPLKEFAIDKASETFSNLAMRSYKEFGNTAPIISIENPPAGSGLNRADDLRDLVEATRTKFIQKAKENGVSEGEAKSQSEKLIGVTWDVGHINMIRKFGYDEKALAEETKKVAKFVKNIHLSDNFGMEHTELPMGMGNVPTKTHMDILDKYNEKIKDVKKVIEAGNWYTQFKTVPFGETLAAFGSPIYSMQLGPSWNQAYGRSNAGYFSGYGMNPDIHHSVYGAGFSGLPVELGGQIAGRSRLSGTSME